MSLNQLKRTLRREFTRNPAKSAMLLALLPVAGYFIAPLAWKQLPRSAGNKEGQPSFLAAAGTKTNVAAGSGAVPPSIPSWQEIAEWMVVDPRTKPATITASRDPFHPVSELNNQVAEAEERAIEQAPSAASLRPEDCGLQLTATIVGPVRQLATINGRLYSPDARVQFGNLRADGSDRRAAASGAADAFVLKSVSKTHVVLERQGEQFRLTIHGGRE